jgi:hypothetical protein
MKKECKKVRGKKYCKINGKWVRVKEDNKSHRESKSQMKLNKNIRTRVGAC